MANSKRKRGHRKAAPGLPDKPYPDFPLTPHRSGAWQKKIHNVVRYFGRWGRVVDGKLERLPDPDYWKPALELYKAQCDDWYAGRTPRVKKVGEGLTLGDLCNAFLTAKLRAVKAAEITTATFGEYKGTTDRLVGHFGKQRLVDDLAADDFAALRASISETWGPVRLANEITRTKGVFKFGYDNGLIVNPIRYGAEFKKPSAAVLRRNKAKNGGKTLEAPAVRQLVEAADPQFRAMILLGINCGFTCKDCADLPLQALDLEGAWINFARPKTGVGRRCALWPETVQALREAIALRPEPDDDTARQRVFLRADGRVWLTAGSANPLSQKVCALMKVAGVHREGIGFAVLRHVFRTEADGCRDQVAINHIMGHSDPSMAGVYRERIDDSRLRAVADFVRTWLGYNLSDR